MTDVINPAAPPLDLSKVVTLRVSAPHGIVVNVVYEDGTPAPVIDPSHEHYDQFAQPPQRPAGIETAVHRSNTMTGYRPRGAASLHPRTSHAADDTDVAPYQPELGTLFKKAATARAHGNRYYYSGTPCRHGHYSAYYVKGTKCVMCSQCRNAGATTSYALGNKALRRILTKFFLYHPEIGHEDGFSELTAAMTSGNARAWFDQITDVNVDQVTIHDIGRLMYHSLPQGAQSRILADDSTLQVQRTMAELGHTSAVAQLDQNPALQPVGDEPPREVLQPHAQATNPSAGQPVQSIDDTIQTTDVGFSGYDLDNPPPPAEQAPGYDYSNKSLDEMFRDPEFQKDVKQYTDGITIDDLT